MSHPYISKWFALDFPENLVRKDNKMSVDKQHFGWSDSRQSLVIDIEHATFGCGYLLISADGTWDAIFPD